MQKKVLNYYELLTRSSGNKDDGTDLIGTNTGLHRVSTVFVRASTVIPESFLGKQTLQSFWKKCMLQIQLNSEDKSQLLLQEPKGLCLKAET